MKGINFAENTMPKTDDRFVNVMSLREVEKNVKPFHESFPQYSVTPLVRLKNMAKYLGVGEIFVKDESYRFSLNAFKVLGGSYAIAKHISKKLKCDISQLNYTTLTSKDILDCFGKTTFYTATDGNHGRGVAWSARVLKQNACVFMPSGTKQIRLDNIKKEGAQASIENANYDECVRKAARSAQENNGVVVQDTAWEGYTEIPTWIMQGYGTMAAEAAEQILKAGKTPTHIFIQAGVGSLAGAVTGYFKNKFPDAPPITIVVEPNEAACNYLSALRGDGSIEIVTGDMPTIMAGLACGEPNIISWDILLNHAFGFIACEDKISAYGMRLLGAPLKNDMPVVSGESGAVGMGLIAELMQNEEYSDIRKELKLDENSVVLLFSTEGDTDPQNYKDIVHKGKYSNI